ncbi:MAG: hypothetical protein JSS34_00080 [Proteobacteria bacterium]|nr:hypothetical protein [Pseudomonadota bacterium]
MTKELSTIPYEDIVQNALRSVMHDALKQVEKTGFPGNHHFYITFQTYFPGVEMSEYLKERYPESVTIVLQHQFWDLHVREHSFSVTLSFSNIKEKLVIPYAAIIGFSDPSVKFSLQFDPVEIEEEPEEIEQKEIVKPKKGKKEKIESIDSSQKEASQEGKVITLDAFRKKK